MSISDFNWSFDLSCCSTPANCTSCWVNWLVSSGSSGFWFFSCVVSSVRKVWKLSAMPVVAVEAVEVLSAVVVPGAATTVVGIVASTDMVNSSDFDVYAAARSEHAAICASRDWRGDGVFFNDQAMCVAARSAAVVLTRRRLVAQAELQAAVARLQAGVIQRALQLGCILAQHRQRFRFFNCQMRSHLAVAIDIDANIDAAEIGGIEPDLEAALAAFCRDRDLKCEPAQWHRRVRRRRDVQWSHRGGRGSRGVELRLDRARGLHADVGWVGCCMSRLGDRRMLTSRYVGGDGR